MNAGSLLLIPTSLPLDLLRPFDSEKMKAWTVSTRVNSTKFDEPDLLAPATPIRVPTEQTSLFA